MSAPDPGPVRGRRRTIGKALLRFLLSGTLIGILLTRTDVGRIGDSIRAVEPAAVPTAFLLVVVGVVVSVYRWRSLMRPLGFRVPSTDLARLYVAGIFFNAFLPTGIGGDVYKAIRLRHAGPGEAGFASIVLDRVAGLVGLAVIGLAAAGVRIVSADRAALVAVALTVGTLVLIGTAVTFGPWNVAATVPDRWRRTSIGVRLTGVVGAVRSIRHEPGALVIGLVAGVLFQGSVVLFHVVLAWGLDLRLPAAVLACTVLVSTMMALVPVTLNGLGLREAIYVWAFGQYGVSNEAALAFGALVLGVTLAASALGGLAYASDERGGRSDPTTSRTT